MLKLDLAIVLVALAGGAVWIERGHRVVIDAPVAADAQASAAAACPDNDTAPYSATCIAFLKGATEAGMRWRAADEPAFAPAPSDNAVGAVEIAHGAR